MNQEDGSGNVRLERTVRRVAGSWLLLLFPLALIADRMFGFVVTGVETTWKESAYQLWNQWKKMTDA